MQPADAGAANGGAAEGGSSSQLLNAAEGGRSTSQHPNDADARPADAKASRQQQAAEVVLPLLQEALRPLVEAQVGHGMHADRCRCNSATSQPHGT